MWKNSFFSRPTTKKHTKPHNKKQNRRDHDAKHVAATCTGNNNNLPVQKDGRQKEKLLRNKMKKGGHKEITENKLLSMTTATPTSATTKKSTMKKDKSTPASAVTSSRSGSGGAASMLADAPIVPPRKTYPDCTPQERRQRVADRVSQLAMRLEQVRKTAETTSTSSGRRTSAPYEWMDGMGFEASRYTATTRRHFFLFLIWWITVFLVDEEEDENDHGNLQDSDGHSSSSNYSYW